MSSISSTPFFIQPLKLNEVKAVSLFALMVLLFPETTGTMLTLGLLTTPGFGAHSLDVFYIPDEAKKVVLADGCAVEFDSIESKNNSVSKYPVTINNQELLYSGPVRMRKGTLVPHGAGLLEQFDGDGTLLFQSKGTFRYGKPDGDILEITVLPADSNRESGSAGRVDQIPDFHNIIPRDHKAGIYGFRDGVLKSIIGVKVVTVPDPASDSEKSIFSHLTN